jgi:hypothetical protein
MPNKQYLEKLATQPRSLLSNTRGIFSLIKALDYDLFECLCSEKLDRAHPLHDMRHMIDTELANHLEQNIDKKIPVHILDIGSGLLFSTAVRIAQLVRRGFKNIHMYVIDPLYNDNLQKRTLPNIHPDRAKMADGAKKAFHELGRLMQDCGINFDIGNVQGCTTQIVNELKINQANPKNEATLSIHIFGSIEQVPVETIQHINAVLIIDIFPPISLYSILGSSRNNLSHEALIFSCKERFFTRSEMINSLSLTEIKKSLSPVADEKTIHQIKECWDNIVNTLYPENANGNFDSFYAAIFNSTFSADTRTIFEDTLKRISTQALEVRITQGSALQYLDWDDAVNISGTEAYHRLQKLEEPVQIYNVNQHRLWSVRSCDTRITQSLTPTSSKLKPL